MTIRTYGNKFILRWQSALYAVLDQGEEFIENLGSDHPAMAATCQACDEIEREIRGAIDHPIVQVADQPTAQLVDKTDLVRACARLYVGLLRAHMMGHRDKIVELENEIRYSVCDPLWAKTLLEYHMGDDLQVPYRRYRSMNDFVIPLPEKDSLMIAFVSDWATGTKVAHNVMRCIAAEEPDLVIHLSDIYYSGTRKEVEENFLNVVRAYIPESVPIYTLAGNHDLYAGGGRTCGQKHSLRQRE